jgi:hypothetical protein
VQADVVQPGDPVGLRRAAGGLPRVEAQVVVVAAGRQEQDVARAAPARHVPRLEHDVEAEDADVERAHPVDVGGAQVHVADANVRVDRVLRGLDGVDGTLRAAHDGDPVRSLRGRPCCVWVGLMPSSVRPARAERHGQPWPTHGLGTGR